MEIYKNSKRKVDKYEITTFCSYIHNYYITNLFLLSSFWQTKIEEINLQTEYNSRISDATYDGVKAFELNTNNENQALSIKQKEKEVEYAIEIFYKTLANRFSSNGMDSDSLKDYTPVILFNLYDGFFIQSKYKNVENNNYEYGLKPYEQYSCRYVKSDDNDLLSIIY